MGKMKELDLMLQELEEHTNAVLEISADIRSFFTSKPESNVSFESNDADWDNYREEEQLKDAKDEEKEAEKKITIGELKPLLVSRAREGKSDQVKALLNKFGYNKLSEVDPKDYKAIFDEAEVL